MKKIILLLANILPICLFGQFHDNTTLLGYRGGQFSPPGDAFGISVLTFPDGKLLVQENLELGMYFDGTNAITSDSNGILQMYTNGGDIGNVQWGNMENGETLTNDGPGPNIWPQFALALPKPGPGNRIALLYGDEELFSFTDPDTILWIVSLNLYAAEIDMNLNNGLGKVISRGEVVIGDTLGIGKFTATKHANGRDWWILAHEHDTDRFYRLLLDPEGIHNLGRQSVGVPFLDGFGQACFSPNGEHYVRYEGIDYDTAGHGGFFHFYDFDRCTGLLSNHRQINVKPGAWGGCAISLDSRYVYFNQWILTYQYDLWAQDLAASQKVVAEYDGYLAPNPTRFMFLQLFPDGKIYSCTSTRSNVLHTIHYPDEPGMACQYEQHAVHLPTRNAFSIPNFPYFRLGPLDGSPCDTLGLNNHPKAWYRYEQDTLNALAVEFRDLSYYKPATWAWDFGDGSPASSTRHPQHQYAQPGAYQACLTVSNQYGADTHCKTLYLGVTAQDNPVLQAQVRVWPNPFHDRFTVALSANLRNPALRLHDAAGRLVLEQRLVLGVNEIETGTLPPGLYIWEVTAGGERVKAGKIAKHER
ncbi:MAG: PKD domain-containing protein [Saprospiraceae bacterium]